MKHSKKLSTAKFQCQLHHYLFPVIQGSIFLDKWRKRPDQILSVGDVVVVATKGSSLFVFDAKSAQFVRKFDVFPSSQLLGKKV